MVTTGDPVPSGHRTGPDHHLLMLMWSQTCQGKAFREMLGSHTCPQARLLSWNIGLVYPMNSSLLAEILDNTKSHSSATLWTGMARSVGLIETSCTTEASVSVWVRSVWDCWGWSSQWWDSEVVKSFRRRMSAFCQCLLTPNVIRLPNLERGVMRGGMGPIGPVSMWS